MTIIPSRITIRERLANGDWLTIWFHRNLTTGDLAKEDILYCWTVAMYIGDRKAANRWKRGKSKKGSKQTGKGSIEGLRLAEKYLLNVGHGWMRRRDELRILWEDDKRMRAYRWLLRHPGFNDYTDEDTGKSFAIGFRHPEYWSYELPGEGAGKQ